jgi:molybdopterin molybdotransferase
MGGPVPAPGCDSTPAMTSVEDAVAAIRAQARTVEGSERIPLDEADGRILADDVVAPVDVPGFDNSAMDGYALHSGDLDTARGTGLAISRRIAAGDAPGRLAPGTAARIFTGAPVPAGADTVVMQEHCRVEGGRVLLEQPVAAGANIRPRGNDIAAGSTILEAGLRMEAAHIGLAASVGLEAVEVRRRVRVALFSTGDELLEPGQSPAPGKIYNSNRYLLRALLHAQGCGAIDLGSLADDYDLIRQGLLRAADSADLVLTSGGVSVGEEDHVRAALGAVGTLALWRVRMKPGKPLAFGRIGTTPFLGLPGNPVSAYVTFVLFVRPFLHCLQGRRDTAQPVYRIRSGFAHRGGGRREYVRVRLDHDAAGEPIVRAYPRQGSDVLSSVAWADGLVEVPEGAEIRPGDPLRYLPLREWAR